jgi:L-amino acid N-acyltransferase
MPAIDLRPATAADAPAIAAIYNHEVENTVVTMDLVPRTVEEQQSYILTRSGAFATIVAVDTDSGEVVGWGALSPYKDRPAYNTSVEDSIYIRRDYNGKGIGRQLLGHLLDTARSHGFHSVLARIEATTEASLALHSKLGFETVGVEREVARKFGRWIDVVLMQIIL